MKLFSFGDEINIRIKSIEELLDKRIVVEKTNSYYDSFFHRSILPSMFNSFGKTVTFRKNDFPEFRLYDSDNYISFNWCDAYYFVHHNNVIIDNNINVDKLFSDVAMTLRFLHSLCIKTGSLDYYVLNILILNRNVFIFNDVYEYKSNLYDIELSVNFSNNGLESYKFNLRNLPCKADSNILRHIASILDKFSRDFSMIINSGNHDNKDKIELDYIFI